MKPRTKLEIEVTKYSKYHPEITKEVKEWAFKNCLEHKGFATKSRVICMDCGENFSPDIVSRKRATCPSCNTKLKIENTRKRTDYQTEIFATAEVCGRFQIIRHFEVYGKYRAGSKADLYTYEILQYWIDDKGKVTMIGRNHNTQGYCDSWGGDWSIRKNNNRSIYHWNGMKYKIYPYKYHPNSEFKTEYKRLGIDHRLDGLMILDAIKVLPKNNKAETLLKAKQYSLLAQCRDYDYKIRNNWPSIKICMRNRYKVKESDLWLDYLDLLKAFNKDIRNAHYVCPKDLKKEHDILVEKRNVIRSAQKLARKKEKAINDQKQYQKEKGKYFGLQLSKKDISIKVLEHVNDFVEESEKLQHCLFSNDYHKRKDSLILKAEVLGQSVETIEVCLKSFTVLQSRGKFNNHSEHHDDILALINSKMNKIAEVSLKKITKKESKSTLQHLLAS